MLGPITVTIGMEILECGDLGFLLALLVDDQVVSLLPLTEEELDQLCN